ncbi:hypothetical protein PPUJ20028_38580 [Pseudomonas putida]|uniref:Uncharacterized protein n=1 Tax=Pseudomonas putida TaxID=303 RepID=A0AA37R8X0_PSEPU|nr:calcium-binding protein [Pseudomonas putida]GLO15273.1 hypothetical protein PPUJ20028_38580 [Pseudomonas putida]GLO33352.1 hypothetical protein PPUN14671_01850 [Pseudomonas putida]HDS0965377.1 hypothetical protein [Pseudomonas putida]HDS0990520.1 hypothetical protein [Pseudomonas putida]
MAIINGNDAANTLTGTTSADTINGLGGNDILQGNAGNDILDGGTGNDRLFGGRGNDVYRYGRGYGNDVIDNSGGAASDVDLIQLTNLTSSQIRLTRVGFDLVLSVLATGETLTVSQCFLDADHALEGIVFADGTRWGVSEALANLYYVPVTPTAGADIINGNPTDDTLLGLGGNDQLYGNYGNDTLDGGSGNDLMVGGQGNDTYMVDAAGDVVVEAAGGGDDLVRASISYTLGNNVEHLTLTGSANLNGTGNGLDNTLIGNTGNNRLDGGAGNDVLFGGEGNDVLMGGAGNDRLDGGTGSDQLAGRQGSDTYVYAQGYGNDLIDNSGGAASDVDTLQLVGLNSNQVRFARVGNDLQMRVLATAETLTVSGFYLRADNEIDRVRFDNGITWNTATLKAAAAQPNAAPTSTNDSQTTPEATALTLGVGDFGSYTDPENNPLVSVMITRLPSAGSLLYLSGSNWVAVVQNQVISKVDLDAGKLQFVPAANANGAGYASISFKVGDGVAYSVAAYTLNIDVTAVPDVPTAVATVTALSNDSGVAGDFITNVEFQTISGSFTGSLNAGERIEVTANGGETWVSAVIDASGHTWSAQGVELSIDYTDFLVRTINAGGEVQAGLGHSYQYDDNADRDFNLRLVLPDVQINGAEKHSVAYSIEGLDADDTATVVFRDLIGHEAVGIAGVADLSGLNDGPIGVLLTATDLAGNIAQRGVIIGGGGAQTTINFDNVAEGTALANQYNGVTFGTGIVISSQPSFPAQSGTHLAFTDTGFIDVNFSSSLGLVARVSMYVSTMVGVTAYAYSGSNVIVASATVPAGSINAQLQLTSFATPISKIYIDGGADLLAIDTLTYAITPAPALVIDSSADRDQPLAVALSDSIVGAAHKTAVPYTITGLDSDAVATITFSDGTHSVLGSNGIADLSGLNDGPISVTVSATDSFGNTATGIGTQLQLDTTNPTAVASVNLLSDDTGLAGDFITNAHHQAVTGTFTDLLNDGEIIQVTADGGNTWINATVLPDPHTWTTLIDLVDGEHALDVRVIDSAGNIRAGVGHTYNLDTNADLGQPALITFLDQYIPGESKGAVSYSLSGLDADATAIVTFRDNAGHVALGQNGVVDLRGFQAGQVGVTLSIEDVAGNTLSRGLSGGGTTTTLNFDTLGDEVPITNQYQSQSVVANGANGVNAIFLGFLSHSGTQVAYSPGGLMSFSLSIPDVRTVSAYLTGPVDVGIFAYDASNNLVG